MMAASSREIEDPASYCKLDNRRIEAVNGLQQLIVANQIKKDRAEYVQQKFEDLRANLAKKLMDARRIEGEIIELEEHLKKSKLDLAKLVKQAGEDTVTLQLVQEDAEQAESQAMLAKEREQNLMLETMDLVRMRDEYTKRIQQMENEHFEALAPVLQRMKMEIKNAGEQKAEDMAKIEETKKEIEEASAKQHELCEELKVVRITKSDVFANVESLEGVPEKFRKQCDILLNALQCVKAQDVKWAAKVKEVDAAIISLAQSTKEKTDVHSILKANFEKFKLMAEEKERVCADIQKEIDVASQQSEELVGDRVQLDMQLMGKLHELKHVHDICANAVKERDRVNIMLKEREDIVSKIKAQMPIYIQEKETAQRELVLAEGVFKTWTEKQEEVRKDVASVMKQYMATDERGKELVRRLKGLMKKVEEREGEIVQSMEVERRQTQHATELTNIRARLEGTAAAKYALWRETTQKIGLVQNLKATFDKRLVELERDYDEAVALNHLVRGQRNKYASLVTASGITITEMKDKITTLNKEVDQFQGEVVYREKVLAKLRNGQTSSVRERLLIRDDITKCLNIAKEKKALSEELIQEIIRLQGMISRVERDMMKARKTYGLAVKDRNQVGISIIDRNDELCILYEKYNVQVEILTQSEVEAMKRGDEIKFLRRECNTSHKAILMEQRTAPDPISVYEELAKLKEQMSKASLAVDQLSELVEKPSNLERWRLLPGRDYNNQELTQKALAVEEFLSAKEDQAYEKDLILEEVTVLAHDLLRRAALARPESIRTGQKFNGYVRQLTLVSRQMMATVSELSLVQAISISTKQERETAQINLDGAYQRLEKGQAPTEKIEKYWQAFLRHVDLVEKMKAARERLLSEDERDRVARIQKKPTHKTTAEQRPNAYISEEKLGLPRPFGAQTPFRPSERGSTIHHIRKPTIKPIEE